MKMQFEKMYHDAKLVQPYVLTEVGFLPRLCGVMSHNAGFKTNLACTERRILSIGDYHQHNN